MVFPPVYLSTLEGIRRTDRQLLEMARVYRVPLSRRLAGIYVPQVLPYFPLRRERRARPVLEGRHRGRRSIAARRHDGERLYTAKVYFQTPDLFAWTAVIVLISALFEKLFLFAVDRLAERVGA